MAEIPNYVVDSGDFTPQEIVDVIPEQTKQDQQVRSQEEKYLQQLEQNAEDRIRNTEKTWEGLSKLSGKVGDIIQKKRDKFRSDRIATLQLKVLTNGVGDNLSEHFETGRELLFQDHVDINTAASNYEAKTGDAYLRFIPRTEMDIAVVGVAISLKLERGVVKKAKVALGAVAPTAVVVPAAARALVGSKLDDAALEKLAAACSAACNPIDDKRGTVEYRTRVAGVLAKRAAKIAFQRAGGAL